MGPSGHSRVDKARCKGKWGWGRGARIPLLSDLTSSVNSTMRTAGDTVLRNREASTQLKKAASAAGFKGGELARVGGCWGGRLGAGAGAGPAVNVCATPRGAQVPSKRSCTKHRPQGQKRTHTLYVLSLLKPAPPFSQIKAVCLNISFLQSEFTFKVQSANTMCFCFCFFNCFLVREPPTRLGSALDVSAT